MKNYRIESIRSTFFRSFFIGKKIIGAQRDHRDRVIIGGRGVREKIDCIFQRQGVHIFICQHINRVIPIGKFSVQRW